MHVIRGQGTRGATAMEHDRAYGAREAGRVTFLAAGDDVLRIECSAPPDRFRALDTAAFLPLVHSFRVLTG